MPTPPIKCTPCRVILDDCRFRVYEDGSVSLSPTPEDRAELGLKTVKDVLDYESKQERYHPHSLTATAVRKEAARLRRNRNAREHNQAMRDLGMTKTRYGWE